MDKKFINAKKASLITGLCVNTVRKYGELGTIEMVKTPGGVRRYYVDKYISERNGTPLEIKEKVKICYCRVSTPDQSSDLENQVVYMKNKYPGFQIITDIGSGINFERKGLEKIIDLAISGKLETLAVSYKDRLCRIGYSLIENILKKYSNTEIIIDAEKSETINEEITNDLLQILTVYTAKIHGMRRYKAVDL